MLFGPPTATRRGQTTKGPKLKVAKNKVFFEELKYENLDDTFAKLNWESERAIHVRQLLGVTSAYSAQCTRYEFLFFNYDLS